MQAEPDERTITIERPSSNLSTWLRLLGGLILLGGLLVLVFSFTASCDRSGSYDYCTARDSGRVFGIIVFGASIFTFVVMYAGAFAIELLLSIETLLANVEDRLQSPPSDP